jgi:GTP-binding protein EngB required for normal cell division
VSSAALEGCLERLGQAIDAARSLGVPTAEAEAVRQDAAGRLGFPSDAYVLALVGGTGVGKSSLLNALAGETVSTASVRRPTTGRPVAWIPAGTRDELGELLHWLGVGEVREHRGIDATGGGGAGGDSRDPLPAVAILDLPDIDSLEPEHRARVEEVLPRVDAVAWVTDPEKYHDAVLHDEFLQRWLRSLDRQVVVLNKTDRLAERDVDAVVRDLRNDTVRLAGRSANAPDVLPTAARGGQIDAVRRWVAQETEAKRVVRARLAAAVAAAADALARAGGVDPELGARPILDVPSRRAALREATEAILAVVDVPAVERQAVAATRARARRRGAGPIAWLTAAIYHLSGREARVADPRGFLVRWRDRGSLAPAVEPLRAALAEPVRHASPAARAAIAGAVEPRQVDAILAGAVDRVVSRTPATPPTSWVWSLIGTLQTVTTVALVGAAAWVVVWILARPPVDEVVLPGLGRVPTPLVVLATALVVGYVLARLLAFHAGWVGRRWARRLTADLSAAIEEAVSQSAFAPLDRLEVAARALWSATRSIAERCR